MNYIEQKNAINPRNELSSPQLTIKNKPGGVINDNWGGGRVGVYCIDFRIPTYTKILR